MNFEHLCKTVAYNIHRLKNKRKTKLYLKYQYEVLKIKKNKLKLGTVTFDLINTIFADLLIRQDIEMRYIRQDNTERDEMKLENRLKALNWKWDYSNILAFLIIFIFLVILLCAALYVWYCNNLPEFAYKDPKYNTLVEKSLQMLIVHSTFSGLRLVLFANILLVDSMIAVCTFFDVLF